MSDAVPTDAENLRQAVFTICQTKEHLHDWVKFYLDLDLPDCIVCDDDVKHPPSNSCPMDLLWELYTKALDGQDDTFMQVLLYAARDSYKTIVASVFETLALFHLKRNPFHVAAIEAQAKRATYYMQKYLKRPYLRDYLVSRNERTIEVCWYNGSDGRRLTPIQHHDLAEADKPLWTEERYKVEILVATLKSLNSGHSSLLVEDELDLCPALPLEEAKMIPSEGHVNRELPMTLMLSSRKFARGPIQDVLDSVNNPDMDPIQIRHWNIIDVTAACPPKRHLPEEPKIPIWYSENRLAAISQEQYDELTPQGKGDYEKDEGYVGCLKNCKIFAACRGRLATKQKSQSRLLKSVRTVQRTFRSLKIVDIAKSQLLNWKPSGEGMVYPTFDPGVHMLTARQIAELMTGEPQQEMGKADLIAFAKSRGAEFFGGMDFGYTHCFAYVVGFRWGNLFFIVDAQEVPELSPSEQIDLCRPIHESLDPFWYADTAQPGSIKDFRKAGFRMSDWKKKPNSVLDGIRVVRSMMTPILGAPPNFFILKDDEGCETLSKRIAKYHWMLDSEGRPTAVPDETDDDSCDAVRYVLMNLFAPRGSIQFAGEEQPKIAAPGQNTEPAPYPTDPTEFDPGRPPTVHNYLSYYISGALGGNSDQRPGKSSGKRGKIFYDFG
jgi:hypothetical protein